MIASATNAVATYVPGFIGAWFWDRLEVWRPEALLALPFLLVAVWLQRRRRAVREVPTTLIWRRVPAPETSTRPAWRWLLFVVVATAALTTPRTWQPPVESRHESFVAIAPLTPTAGTRLELSLPPGQGRVEVTVIEVETGETVAADAHALDPQRPTAWTIEQRLRSGRHRVSVLDPDGTQSDYTFDNPGKFPAVPVVDHSAPPAVQRVLDAMIAEGWARRSTIDSPSASAITFAQLGSGAESSPGSAILFASAGGDGLLPAPRASEVAPLLAGLAPHTWNILSCHTQPHSAWPADDILLDSDLGPLIYRSGEGSVSRKNIVVQFAPSDSDLPQRAEWPVLIGRLLESIAPRTSTIPVETSTPSSLPTWILLALAAVVAGTLGLGRLQTLLVVLLIAAAAVTTPGVGGWRAVPTCEINATEHSFDLLTEVRSLGNGGRLVITDPPPAPARVEDWGALLQARGVELEISYSAPDLIPESRSVPVATPVIVRAESATRPANTTVDTRTPELFAISPDGTRELATLLNTNTWQHTPPEVGLWYYEWTNGVDDSRTSVTVTGPYDILSCTPVGNAAPPTLGGVGTATGYQRRTLSNPPTLTLPDSQHGFVVWDGLDPSQLPPEELEALATWVKVGGTLLASVGPPFVPPSAATDRLSELLPAPLPAPPTEPEIAFGIVLLDLSGSLRGAPLDDLVTAVGTLLSSTPEGGRWGVAYFRDRAGWIAPPGTPIDERLLERLPQLTASGGTRLDLALPFVSAELEKVETGRSLILITDGQVDLPSPTAAGRALRDDAIDLRVVCIGSQPNETLLQSLAGSAGGEYRRAPSSAAAAAALSDLFDESPPHESPLQGPVRGATLSPLLAGLPAQLPAPRRYVAVTAYDDSRPLLVDANGAPLLLRRTIGSGQSLLWCAPMTEENIPSDSSARRIVEALTTITTNAVRGQPTPLREVRPARGVAGGDWITFTRARGEGAQIDVRTGTSGTTTLTNAPAVSADRYQIPREEEHRESVVLEREEHALLDAGTANRRAWQRLEVASQGAARPPRIPIDVVAIVAAILVALGSRRATRRS